MMPTNYKPMPCWTAYALLGAVMVCYGYIIKMTYELGCALGWWSRV